MHARQKRFSKLATIRRLFGKQKNAPEIFLQIVCSASVCPLRLIGHQTNYYNKTTHTMNKIIRF